MTVLTEHSQTEQFSLVKIVESFMCDGYNQTKDGSRLTGSTEAFQRHTVCWPRSRSEQKSSFTVIVLCMSNSLFEADTVNSNSVLSSLLIMLPATAATVP